MRVPGSGSERDAPENLSKAGGVKGCEAFAGRQALRAYVVSDYYQLVWIRALVAVAADGGGYGIEGRCSVSVHDAGDVTQAIASRRPRQSGPKPACKV